MPAQECPATCLPLSISSITNYLTATFLAGKVKSLIRLFCFVLTQLFYFLRAVALSSKDFIRINGYSNTFYGWGGEDDDLYFRVSQAKLSVVRFGQDIGIYHMLNHKKEVPNPDRNGLMKKSKHQHAAEGLNSLNYTLLSYELKQFYTWLFVSV